MSGYPGTSYAGGYGAPSPQQQFAGYYPYVYHLLTRNFLVPDLTLKLDRMLVITASNNPLHSSLLVMDIRHLPNSNNSNIMATNRSVYTRISQYGTRD